MKRLILLVILLAFPSVCFAYSKTTIQTGSDGNKIDIIFIPSGYTSGQSASFETEVTGNLTKLWLNNFFGTYQQRFNVYRIDDEYDADGLVKSDGEVETLIDGDSECSNEGYGDGGTVTCIHVVIDDAAGTDEALTNFVRLRNAADDDYSMAHEVGVHVLGDHQQYDGAAGLIMKDGYACASYTDDPMYLYSNVTDSVDQNKWSDLGITPTACSSVYIPSWTVTSYLSTYADFSNVGYKAAQIGLAKRSQDSVEYADLSSDFTGTKQYGQDVTAPTTVVEGIQGSHTYYGPTNVRVYPTDAGTGIDYVLWVVDDDDSAEYQTVCVDKTAPYTCYFDPNLYTGTMSMRIYTFDEAWNYKVDQYDSIAYTHYERIGEGCTTGYFIDRDCDGYGIGSQWLNGTDADDKDIIYNTTASVEVGYGDLDGCTTTDTSCATHLEDWLAVRTDKAYTSKADVFYIEPGGSGSPVVNQIANPYASINDAIVAGAGADDIIVLRGGTYTSLNNSFYYKVTDFSEGNDLIVIGMPGEAPLISFSAPGAIFTNGDERTWDYIIFDSFMVQGPSTGSYTPFYTSGGVISNCQFRNLEMTDNYYAYRLHSNIVNNTFEYNLIYDAGNHPNYMQYNQCYSSGPCSGNVYRGFVVYQTGENPDSIFLQWGSFTYALGGYWSGLIIEDSIFHGAKGRVLSCECGHKETTIRNNVFFNNNQMDILFFSYWSEGSSKCYDSGEDPDTFDDNIIVNNTFWRGLYNNGLGLSDPTEYQAIQIGDQVPESVVTGFVIQNNVFWIGGAADGGDNGIFQVNTSNNISDWTVSNNIIYRQNSNIAASVDGVQKTTGAGGTFEAMAPVSNNNYADPYLDSTSTAWEAVDDYLFNLDLTASSTNAHNGGISTLAPSDDIHGDTRVGLPDIGADEYTLSAAEMPTISGCTISGGTVQ